MIFIQINSLRLTLVLILVFIGISSHTQVSRVDSLKREFLDETSADTSRIKSLLLLGETRFRRDSLLYFHEIFTETIREKGSTEEKLIHFYQKGRACFYTDQFSKAELEFDQLYSLAESNDNIKYKIKSLTSLGTCYIIQANYYKAADVLLSALDLAKSIQDQRELQAIQGNLGIAYRDMKKYDESILHFSESLKIAESRGDSLNICRSYSNIGVSHFRNNQLEQAKKSYNTALSISERKGYKELSKRLYLNLGDLELDFGNISLAKKAYFKSIELANEINSPNSVAMSQVGLAKLFYKLKPDTAEYLAQRALETGMNNANLKLQRNALKILYDLKQSKGMYKDAFEFQSDWIELKDSIERVENKKAVYQIEAKLEYERLKELETIKYENELSKKSLEFRFWLALMALALILGISVFSIFFYRRHIKTREERNNLLFKIDTLKNQLVSQSVNSMGSEKSVSLDRDAIEKYLESKLGETSWIILNSIFKEPSISNKRLADEVHLSVEGLSSSLRRMYKSFDIEVKNSHNKKVALISKVVDISIGK